MAAAVAAFELERFEWAAPGRLEIEGRWTGLRARRFIRPTLVLHGPAGRVRLLALLEHKPWAALDGDAWIAAFEHEAGEAEYESAELTVAPGIDLPLPPPKPALRSGKPRALKPRRIVSRDTAREEAEAALDVARAEGAPVARRDATAAERRAVQRWATELQEAEDRAKAAEERADQAVARSHELTAERDAATAERDAVTRERDALVVVRDALTGQLAEEKRRREALERELDLAKTSHNSALADAAKRERERLAELKAEAAAAQEARDLAADERDQALSERTRATRDRDSDLRERTQAMVERDVALKERDRAMSERKKALSERDRADAARAAAIRENERVTAQRVGPPRSWSDAARQSTISVWLPRIVAVAILVMLVAVLLVLTRIA